jgi:lysosomal acid lipase/cholesteryl ester hydrolase
MLMFLLFGRRSILSSVVGWKSILYAPIFSNVIDMSMDFLFGWTNANISTSQKLGAFAHLYSYSSTKAVVHWFQIMRTAAFIMYDDHGISPFGSSATAYRPVRFPTQNIVTPIVILYGEKDSLVDIDVLLKELPEHTVAKGLENYEHLDLLWGQGVHIDVIPLVLDALDEHSVTPANACRLESGTHSPHYF